MSESVEMLCDGTASPVDDVGDGTGNTNICADWAGDGTQVCVPPSLAPSAETAQCVFSRSWPEITDQGYLYATGKHGVKNSSLLIVFVSDVKIKTIHTST